MTRISNRVSESVSSVSIRGSILPAAEYARIFEKNSRGPIRDLSPYLEKTFDSRTAAASMRIMRAGHQPDAPAKERIVMRASRQHYARYARRGLPRSKASYRLVKEHHPPHPRQGSNHR